MRNLYVVPAALTLLMAASANAGMSTAASQEKKELVEARNEVAAQAAMTKGAAQQHFDLERRHLDELIKDLEQGRAVSPGQVERAIGESRTTP